jgi:hypothetical protein
MYLPHPSKHQPQFARDRAEVECPWFETDSLCWTKAVPLKKSLSCALLVIKFASRTHRMRHGQGDASFEEMVTNHPQTVPKLEKAIIKP